MFKCLCFLDLDHLSTSSHSLRIEAAMVAAKSGFSDATVRQIGGWEWNYYNVYVLPNLSF